ncbi:MULTISPECIES: hypothetical protein [Paenibacillus]|uniref:Uncharacterized protein n=1 Tax=Paenibacillus vandeheii TaxID=3035917 RepID=A0ABT8JG23_9BACL|nr:MULTISPECIES: hypothetical protein [Paenibacillus]KGP78301.1 hypothetical protein P363_0132305 [Paenibacillus sp. MAEPY1]KGP78427.1 hypothetical protein P364_0128730 [Paenibacillus sp. MAEPY2]MDN4604017.1 hypothetical protein [Paenibacillus vandeheii]
MECMNCGSTNDTTDLLSNNEKVILCVDCRFDLATGKLKLPLKTMGRPSLGITKKVSLTMTKQLWEHLEVKSYNNRSDYLRSLVNRDFQEMISDGQWDNEACLGYAILGAKRLGYSSEQIKLLVKAINGEFDVISVGEARKEYEESEH